MRDTLPTNHDGINLEAVHRPAALAASVLEALPPGARGCKFLELAGRLPDIGLARLAALTGALAELGLLHRRTDADGSTVLSRAVPLASVRGRRGAR
jgi:hypothetical protein